MEGADSFFHSGSDIVTKRQTCDEVSHDKILVSLKRLILLACSLTLLHSLMDILHRSIGAFVVFFEDGLQQTLILSLVAAHIVN